MKTVSGFQFQVSSFENTARPGKSVVFIIRFVLWKMKTFGKDFINRSAVSSPPAAKIFKSIRYSKMAARCFLAGFANPVVFAER
jgi:hypothetical protein